MSRDKGSVFKISGSMALGSTGSTSSGYSYSTSDYNFSQEQINVAKNSLQLLKAKQRQQQQYQRADAYQSSDYTNYPSSMSNYNSDYAPKGSYNTAPIISTTQSYGRKYEADPFVKQLTPQQLSSNSYGKSRTDQRPRDHYSYNNDVPTYNRKQAEVPQPVRTNKTYDQTQKPIAQLKRQSKLPAQQEYAETDLVECSAGCGRKFNPESIEKHENICKKVFQSKRKQFNVQAQRVVEKDQVKLMKKGAIAEKKIQQKKKQGKIPKWKAQSSAFRAMLKANSGVAQSPQEYREAQKAQQQALGYVNCPYCGRNFNDQAGKRHIPFCQTQAKKRR